MFFQFLHHCFQQASRTGGDGSPSLRIEEADEEEWHIILPRDSPESAQLGDSDQIPVSILLVADGQLLEVGAVVHVPAENDRAETEAILDNG